MNILETTIELVIGFFSLFVATKLIGKTQLSQITPFDFVSAMVMGELLGNAIYDREVGILLVLYTLTIWATLMLVIETISQKFLKSRAVLEGNPDIIIRNGFIDKEIMKKNRLDMNTLLELLRKKDIFTIHDVEYAILEPSGNLSVLKKSRALEVTREDLELPLKTVSLATALIIDGDVLYDNLDGIGFNINWLKKEIEEKGYQNIKNVFYAEWSDSSGLFIQ